MRTKKEIEQIKDYEEDIADYEKSVKEAEVELEDAKKWLAKQKVNYAEAIIKLYNYLKEDECIECGEVGWRHKNSCVKGE